MNIGPRRRAPLVAAAEFDPASAGQGSPPGVLLRLAVMTYEAVLLFGLVFVVGYALLLLTGWTYPLPPPRRWVLQAVLFVAIGAYFVFCWTRAGQTLAMKSWRLRVVDRDGRPLSPARATLRYLLAWTLFAPGFAFIAFADVGAVAAAAAVFAGLLVMLAPARFGPARQLLHDRVLGSRVVRD